MSKVKTDNYILVRNSGEKNFRSATFKKEYELLSKKNLHTLINIKTKLVYDKYLSYINSCPIDKNKNFEFLFYKDGLKFVKCKGCNFIFINPRLNQEALNLIYSNKELSKFFVEKVLESKVQKNFDKLKYKKVIKELINLIPVGGSVIDVGCANGLFLHLCQEHGLSCKGVEISQDIAQYARSKFNLEIISKRWEDVTIQNESIDLITFWASHSYTQDPVKSLYKAWKALKKKGLLFMLIDGNPDSLVMRTLQEKCVGFEYSRSWYFSPKVISDLLKSLNFKIIKVESIIHNIDPILNYLDYKDPYNSGNENKILTKNKIKCLEKFLCQNNMGYKYKVLAKKI